MVEIIEREQNLAGVEDRRLRVELFSLAHQLKELAAGNVFEKKVQQTVRVGRPVQADEEWMIDLRQDVLFALHVLHLPRLDDALDAHRFQRVVLTAVSVKDDVHASERS